MKAYDDVYQSDDEGDLFYLTKACEYHQSLQQEGQSSHSRNSIYHDYELAKHCQMANNFGGKPRL